MKDKKVLLMSCIIVFFTLLLISFCVNTFKELSGSNFKETEKEPIFFGATYMTMNNPYFEIINDEIESVINSKGDHLITLDPALSKEKQIEQIRYLIKKKVQIIFVNPIDVNSLSVVLEECRSANIMIVAVDTDLNGNDYANYTVVSDNYNAGVQAAHDMMRVRSDARIVLLEHSTTNSGAQRIQGFVDTIKGNDHYKIVVRKECEGQLEIATPIMSQIIKDGITFDVVMALNDPSALGALAAMQEANIQDVLVYGVDGSPESKLLIKDGKMQGSVSQSPISIGKESIDIAYKLLSNKVKGSHKLIPVTLINENNIDDFSLEGWQ